MEVNPKFKIGQTVYHVTKESDPGVVVDWRYFGYLGVLTYQVSFDPLHEGLFYYEHELSETKKFI